MAADPILAATLGADWLGASRRAAGALRDVLAARADHRRARARDRRARRGRRPHAGDRRRRRGRGVRRARRACTTRARASPRLRGARRGVDFGGDATCSSSIDPIDGSLNAKRGLPHHALSIAVADGPTMADVVFGYVYDFGARRGVGARARRGRLLDGEPLDPRPRRAPHARRQARGARDRVRRPALGARRVRRARRGRPPRARDRLDRASRSARSPPRASTAWRRCAAAARSTPPPRS